MLVLWLWLWLLVEGELVGEGAVVRCGVVGVEVDMVKGLCVYICRSFGLYIESITALSIGLSIRGV